MLMERIRVLEALVAELRAENERLKREGRRQAAPFSKGERKAAPKKPGRKPGEGRFSYRTRPDTSEISEAAVEVPLAHTACPACGGALDEVGVDLCWRTELPALPRPEVREYRVQVARCTHCGKRVRGAHPEVAPDQVGASAHRLGPRLLAAAHVLHYGVGVPLRRVPALLAELWGVRVTQGALTQAALRQAKGNALLCYETLRSEVAGSAVCHTDPTGWRVGGESAQLAVFETEAASVYTIGPTHTNEDVRAVIGNAYAGVLVTDRASRYDAHALESVRQQKCLSHVLRSLSEVSESKRGSAKAFSGWLTKLLRQALRLWTMRRSGEITEQEYRRHAERIDRELTRRLRERLLTDPDNQRLVTELGWHHDGGSLLRFLEEENVEPTNNRAERALRPAVISRKVSHCSKTWPGARAYAIFCSLVRTSMQRQARSGVDALVRILGTGLPPPPPALTHAAVR